MKGVEKSFYNYNPVNIVNGLLAGLVSITASCNNVENAFAVVIGFIGGLWYMLATFILLKLKVDDPVHASQIHCFCGIWGVISVGLFDNDRGLIYSGDFKQLGIQVLGVVALILWTLAITIPYFFFLNRMKRLRVPPIYEIIGLDMLMHEETHKLSYISDLSIKILEHQKKINQQKEQQSKMISREQSLRKY